MDLNLQTVRTNGRASKQLVTSIGRNLTSEDIAKLSVERGVQKPIPSVKRLSDRHKNLARLLAAGKPEWEAALICGYTGSYVSILKTDPAFQELLKIYREDNDIIFRTAAELIAGMSVDALELLAERLEGETDKISLGQLLEINKFLADRSGNGPQTSNTNVNIHIDTGSRLEAARKRVEAARRAKVVEDIPFIEGTKNVA